MKKLLVTPIMLVYYLLMTIPFIIQLLLIFVSKTAEWLQSLADQLSICLEDYIMRPAARINDYAIQIMQSDKTIKWMHEASEKLKQGKPIE